MLHDSWELSEGGACTYLRLQVLSLQSLDLRLLLLDSLLSSEKLSLD